MNDGVLRFEEPLDYEMPEDSGTDNVYNVTVKVADAGGLSATRDVTLNLTNVNEEPTITAGPATMDVPENSTPVGNYTASDVDDSDTQTWSVESDDDGDLFEIDEDSGALSFINAPNFEDKQDAGGNNVYNVTVKVTDGGDLSATRDVAVTVTNVNEAPEITTVHKRAGLRGQAGRRRQQRLQRDGEGHRRRRPERHADVAVTVTNVNEAPVITTSATTASVPENGIGDCR